MRIYSFTCSQGAYFVIAPDQGTAILILRDEIGDQVRDLQPSEAGMSLAVMFEPDFGYVVARTEEMLSPL
jgi:hypothetical protein